MDDLKEIHKLGAAYEFEKGKRYIVFVERKNADTIIDFCRNPTKTELGFDVEFIFVEDLPENQAAANDAVKVYLAECR